MTARTPAAPPPRPSAMRGVGMAMLGSAMALAALAALAYAGIVPFDSASRGWVAAGVALAALIDGAIGVHFLRASSQS